MWTGVSLLIVFAVIAMMWLSEKATPSGVGPVLSEEIAGALSTDRVKGAESAKVTIIEYSDFECPACAAAAPLIKDLLSEYGNDVRFVYRHFPLPSHRNSEVAAYAAEAAGEQGKFFEMHDLLFEKQDEWRAGDPTGKFREYAALLGLDTEKFVVDMNSGEVKSKVAADKASAYGARINATPTFFVNGKSIVGIDLQGIKNEIEGVK